MSGTVDPPVTSPPTESAAAAPPLDDVMLAMDVVDTLRHRQDLVERELDASSREKQLIDKLREIYRDQGIEVPDRVLKEGVDALSQSRFVYAPPPPSFAVTLARFYVGRKKWGPAIMALSLLLILGLGGYFLAYRPYVQGQAAAAQHELAVQLPAEMDAVYATIFNETKVQQAAVQAEELVARGKTAAAEGNREGALEALSGLNEIRDQLRQEYNLRVVNRPGVQSGFWTFPEVNTDATNYYVVVEALDPEGTALTLPILNEENDTVERVDIWGLRVSESVYRSVEADKRDDGIIQRNIVGIKQYGFLDTTYTVPVLGGAVTRW